MSKEKIQFEITFNKDIFAVQYLDHNGYVDPTATQGSTSNEPGELMVAKGSKATISEQSFISMLSCDGLSTLTRDKYTDLPLCYSYSLKDICNVRKITTWTQVEENWKDAYLYDKDSIIGYKGSINCATQIDKYKTKMWMMKPGGVVHNSKYHQERWMKNKEEGLVFNTKTGQWIDKKDMKKDPSFTDYLNDKAEARMKNDKNTQPELDGAGFDSDGINHCDERLNQVPCSADLDNEWANESE